MGPPQGERGRDALDDYVDAIDLTLSSPEPEVRPQPHVNARQQQPATRLKQELGSSSRNMHNSIKHTQQQGVTRTGHVPQQQQHRQVHPQHVTQIIDSSSPRALRQVVLQLCKTSPALSGAIARGLAPHSRYAQALIRSHQSKSQVHTTHTAKEEPKSNGRDVYERTKKRLEPSSSMRTSAARFNSNRPPGASDNRDGLRVPSSQNVPKVKREYSTSSTDSDDSTHIVGFPDIEHDAFVHEPRIRTHAGNVSRQTSTANLGSERLVVRQRPTQQHAAPDLKPKLCTQCGELFKEGDVNCYFHPGCEIPTSTDDIPKYTCCKKFVGEPGCAFGRHASERNRTLSSMKRPSPSLFDGTQHPKKPRVL